MDNEFVCKKNHVNLIVESGTAIMLNLESVLEAFGQEAENIKGYLEHTFLDQGVQIQFITIDGNRSEKTVNLKDFEELNPNGIKLDSYLKGISVYWDIHSDGSKVSEKLSDLCTDGIWSKGERKFAEFDFDANRLCMKDLKGDELQKYIENGYMMVLKVQGIKKENKMIYEEWKRWNSQTFLPPNDMMQTIYFPIKYDESMLRYCEDGGHADGGSGAFWYSIVNRFKQDIFNNLSTKRNIEDFYNECEMLVEEIDIELGIFPIIRVGKNHYIEYYDNQWRGSVGSCDENETYWHGIRLDNGKIMVGINIVGTINGKCVVNILNNDIFPNITRDNLVNDEKDTITSAIERAAYQYIVSKLTDDRELQMALQDYINKSYSADNPFYAMD